VRKADQARRRSAGATLRRRILLERAAYRLLTTNEGVLGVAVEAGYSSHEAFTRAFHPRVRRRAVALAPAHELPAPGPSQVHSSHPGSLRIPAPRKATSMDLLNRMVEHHLWLVGEMLN
jgi:AraC family transcriptional regulator